MSELKNVGIVINSLKIPQQDYEHLITFFNLYNDSNKVTEVLNDDRFDLFGVLPKGFDFKDEKTIERIVNTFNESPEAIALVMFPSSLKQECPYFINKRILNIIKPIQNLSDMLSLIKEHGLEARQASEEVFIYDGS